MRSMDAPKNDRLPSPTFLLLMATPGGVSGGPRRYLEHGRQLARAGFRVYVLTNGKSGVDLGGGMRGVVISNRSGRPVCSWALYLLWAVGRARKVVRGLGVDYVFIYGSNNILAANRLKKITGARLIFDPRQDDIVCLMSEWHAKFAKARGAGGGWGSAALRVLSFDSAILVFRLLVTFYVEWVEQQRCDFWMFQTEANAAGYRGRLAIAESEYAVLGNSVRVPWIQRARRGSAVRGRGEPFRLLYCGALVKRKGIGTLIDACAQLQRDGVGFSLTVVGAGASERAVREQVAGEGLGKRVTLSGWVDDVPGVMSEHDLLVVPSLTEVLPDTILEALHVGVPVVGSDIPGVRAALGEVPELLFPPGSAGELRERLGELITSEAAYKRAVKLCRARYKVFDFDWAERFAEILPIINARCGR